jgi:hypothetical protein
MEQRQTHEYFRAMRYAYPWWIAAAILFCGAYVLATFAVPDGAVLAFAFGLIIAAIGLKLVRQPAARLGRRLLTLSDPRGLSLKTRSYSLDQVRRIAIVTGQRGFANRLRGEVLMVNLTGVPDGRIDDFIHEIESRGLNVGR